MLPAVASGNPGHMSCLCNFDCSGDIMCLAYCTGMVSPSCSAGTRISFCRQETAHRVDTLCLLCCHLILGLLLPSAAVNNAAVLTDIQPSLTLGLTLGAGYICPRSGAAGSLVTPHSVFLSGYNAYVSLSSI